MSHLPAELCPDCSGIGVMAVCRDPVRHDTGDRLGGSENAFMERGISGSKPIDGNPEAVPRNRVICNFSQWGVRGTGDALAASRAFVPSRHKL